MKKTENSMVTFIDVVKRFGHRTVLNEISFRVEQGEILFILGTSGTGKSVTLKNIVGLLRPDGGQIWVDNEEVSKFSEEDYFRIRQKCGMVFQHPALFDSMTIFENVAFGIRKHTPHLQESEIRTQVLRCLSLVHIPETVANLLPNQISYGMQKRVSLARTIAIQPKILLFDEPTTGLDPVTTRAINRLIFDLSRELKTTSLVVSHDMVCALEIADRIIVLDKGKVIAEGSPAEFKKSSESLVQEFLAESLENESFQT